MKDLYFYKDEQNYFSYLPHKLFAHEVYEFIDIYMQFCGCWIDHRLSFKTFSKEYKNKMWAIEKFKLRIGIYLQVYTLNKCLEWYISINIYTVCVCAHARRFV